jgi:hypothetical protein
LHATFSPVTTREARSVATPSAQFLFNAAAIRQALQTCFGIAATDEPDVDRACIFERALPKATRVR